MTEEVEEFKCPECNAIVTENDLVCPKCGLEFEFEEEPTEELEEEPIVKIGLEEGLTREDIEELKSAVELSFERIAKDEETQVLEDGENGEEVLFEDDDG